MNESKLDHPDIVILPNPKHTVQYPILKISNGCGIYHILHSKMRGWEIPMQWSVHKTTHKKCSFLITTPLKHHRNSQISTCSLFNAITKARKVVNTFRGPWRLSYINLSGWSDQVISHWSRASLSSIDCNHCNHYDPYQCIHHHHHHPLHNSQTFRWVCNSDPQPTPERVPHLNNIIINRHLHHFLHHYPILSCPRQLNRWLCQSVSWVLISGLQ